MTYRTVGDRPKIAPILIENLERAARVAQFFYGNNITTKVLKSQGIFFFDSELDGLTPQRQRPVVGKELVPWLPCLQNGRLLVASPFRIGASRWMCLLGAVWAAFRWCAESKGLDLGMAWAGRLLGLPKSVPRSRRLLVAISLK